MALALKSKNADCYVSDRVFDGVRAKDAEAGAKHVARVKRLLSRTTERTGATSADSPATRPR